MYRYFGENKLFHNALGSSDAAVQKCCGNDGFHGICQNGIAVSAAETFLAVTQQQMLTDTDHIGRIGQGGLADHICPHPGQLALGAVGEAVKQEFRHQHTQHAVSQKLQPLVAQQAVVPALIGVGGVGQGILQEGDILKAITQSGFQILKHSRSPSP